MAFGTSQGAGHCEILFLFLRSGGRKRQFRLQGGALNRFYGHGAPVAREHGGDVILVELAEPAAVFGREHPVEKLHEQVHYAFAGVDFGLVALLVVVADSHPARGVERHITECADELVERHAVLEGDRESLAEGVEHAVDERAALPQPAENFGAIAGFGDADGHVAVYVVADGKLYGLAPTAVGQTLADGDWRAPAA